MWRWEDVKMSRCEDERMWRWEDVKMKRCEDERMWRWDVKMRRCEGVKMRRCEDEKMWRWEDVKMRECEDEMWRWEDVLQTPTIGRTLRSDALGKNGSVQKWAPFSPGFSCGCKRIHQWKWEPWEKPSNVLLRKWGSRVAKTWTKSFNGDPGDPKM